MESKTVGLIENNTAMRSSFSILKFQGTEIYVLGFMLQEGLDTEACGFLEDREKLQTLFPTEGYFRERTDDVEEIPRTVSMEGINPGVFVESLKKYAENEGVADLSETALQMATDLELAYQERLAKIEDYLAKQSTANNFGSV